MYGRLYAYYSYSDRVGCTRDFDYVCSENTLEGLSPVVSMAERGSNSGSGEVDVAARSLEGSPTETTSARTSGDVGSGVDSATDETKTDSLEAEFTISHANLPLTEVTERRSAVSVSIKHVTPTEDARLLVFSVHGESLDGFDRSLAVDHTVSNRLLIAGSCGSRIYRVELADHAVSVRPRLVEAGGHATTVEIREGNWDISAQFVAREALSDFRRYCAGEEISFRLHKLCLVDEEGNREGGGLTPNQRKTLQRAYRSGYFEVPRGVTQTELAELLDVSPSAVSQRVRRAIDRLVAQQTWSGDE